MLTQTWGIDILFKNLTPEIVVWIWKASVAHYAYGTVEISFKACLLFNVFSGDLHFNGLIIGIC